MSDAAAQTYEGGCHCGRVRFRVAADLSRVTYCNCSICSKKGFLHLIVPPEQFELLSGRDALTTYRFNTGVAQHTFCATCGIHPFYVPRSDPDKLDINVRCLDGVDLSTIAVKQFDGKNWEHAMAIRDGRHVLTVRVYYEDTDFTGIVYHANYLRYMERGRTNYLRLLGADHRALFEESEREAPGFAFVVRSMNIDFLKPARMDDVLEILTEPKEVKGASITLHQRIRRGADLLVEAAVRVAFVSGGRARPIPRPLRTAMKADQDVVQS
jgi:acyl-CoA thioester hydrolase